MSYLVFYDNDLVQITQMEIDKATKTSWRNQT